MVWDPQLLCSDLDDTILVTHQGCLDGSGCAIMFLGAGGREENIRYCPPGQIENFLRDCREWREDRPFIFADIAPRSTATEFFDTFTRRGRFAVIDHHKTSQWLAGDENCFISMDACGTELLRQRFVKHGFMREWSDDAFRRFAMIIDDHDRWLRNDPRSEDLALLMNFYGQKEFVKNFRNPELRFVDEHFWKQFELETLRILRRKRIETIERVMRRVNVREVSMPTFFNCPIQVAYVVSSAEYVSSLLAAILDKFPDCAMAVQVDFDRGAVSLRSRGEFDVEQFASLFGGGGHRAAAAHPIPRLAVYDLLETIHPER